MKTALWSLEQNDLAMTYSPSNCGEHFWQHCHNDDAKTRVTFTNEEVYCPDVVDAFGRYLMAVGFTQRTVIEAFVHYVEEYGFILEECSQKEMVGESA